MSEAYVQVEELLSEVKARVLSVPCPQCGGLQDEPVKLSEDVKCKYCGSLYSVESCLNNTSTEALKSLVSNVVDDALGKYDIVAAVQLEKLTNLLQSYTDQAFEEASSFYNELGRLPLREELDKRLEERTQQILEKIALFSEKLLEGQETISVKVDEVTDRVESVRISIKEIKQLLESMEQTYGGDWHRFTPEGKATLTYVDSKNLRRELHLADFVIGRSGRGWELEARYPDGRIQPLGLTDPTVSRRHIEFTIIEATPAVLDLRSKNGTYVNGRKIPGKIPIGLHNGDEIRLGLNTKFKIECQIC